jgi:hypothetical protein
MCFDFWTFLPAAFLDCRWKDPGICSTKTELLQSDLQHISSNPVAHDYPCARQPCLALSPTKCDMPSVERRPRYPGKLPKPQLQQLRPLMEFGCSQVHLFGNPVKSHHPSCSSPQIIRILKIMRSTQIIRILKIMRSTQIIRILKIMRLMQIIQILKIMHSTQIIQILNNFPVDSQLTKLQRRGTNEDALRDQKELATEVTSKKLCRCVWLVTSVD